MSGLRDKIADLVDAISRNEVSEPTDAVLRVLAERGDTQQVREQIREALDLTDQSYDREVLDAVMAVVAPIVAERDAAREVAKTHRVFLDRAEIARDAAVERAKWAERRLIDAAGFDVADLMHSLDECTARAERAEADLAAARQQLGQVRADTLSWAADECHREARSRIEKRRAHRPGDPEYDMRTEGVETASKLRDIFRQQADRAAAAVLDAPARPAGHDESGQ